MVKSTGCNSGGPGFDSQLPSGGSQPPATLVPQDPTPSSSFHGHCTHMVNRHTRRQNANAHTHKINIKKPQRLISLRD